jgi:hypothetical protein
MHTRANVLASTRLACFRIDQRYRSPTRSVGAADAILVLFKRASISAECPTYKKPSELNRCSNRVGLLQHRTAALGHSDPCRLSDCYLPLLSVVVAGMERSPT